MFAPLDHTAGEALSEEGGERKALEGRGRGERVGNAAHCIEVMMSANSVPDLEVACAAQVSQQFLVDLWARPAKVRLERV